jgi:hypothetical protein
MANKEEDSRRGLIGALVGAVVAFVITYVLYVWGNPILEARSDWLREMQGFLWSAIPVGTLVGALLGWRIARKRSTGVPSA